MSHPPSHEARQRKKRQTTAAVAQAALRIILYSHLVSLFSDMPPRTKSPARSKSPPVTKGTTKAAKMAKGTWLSSPAPTPKKSSRLAGKKGPPIPTWEEELDAKKKTKPYTKRFKALVFLVTTVSAAVPVYFYYFM